MKDDHNKCTYAINLHPALDEFLITSKFLAWITQPTKQPKT